MELALLLNRMNPITCKSVHCRDTYHVTSRRHVVSNNKSKNQPTTSKLYDNRDKKNYKQ